VPTYQVEFKPLDQTVTVERGTSLLEAAVKGGLAINSVCGGDGICGRCKMLVKQGKVGGKSAVLLTYEEARQGTVLACQSTVESDLLVEIPEQTLAQEKIAIDRYAQRFHAIRPGVRAREFKKSPLVFKAHLALEPPTLEDHLADSQRIQRAVEKQTQISSIQTGLKILKHLPEILRQHAFEITATIGWRRDIAEIMDIEGGDTSRRNYLAIVDVGTSTIVVHLVDANEMSTVGAQVCFNSQAMYGCDVTARIIAAEKKGGEYLQELVVDDINRLISTITAANNVSLKDITAIVCAGNPTMTHFLLGLPTGNIRRHPFIAVDTDPPPFRAAEIGIKINPRGLLFVIPSLGSWVGGDLTAGILATGLHEMTEVGMLIDIGTNGEIVVGNNEWLIACSASTGPALEGASVECGMVAAKGAIEKVYLKDGQIRYDVIGDVRPEGLCGSGIIDLLAVLLERKIVDRAGQFIKGSHPALEIANERRQWFLVEKEKTATGKGIYLTQDDIANVITAKAAVFAASKIILDRLKLDFADIKRLFIAGGFGNYINLENAIKIGLLPFLPKVSAQYAGNTSIWGARIAAFSQEAYHLLREIRKKTTCYDLMGSSDYVEQFRQAMFLPHTNIEFFMPPPCREN
jgi:uncharacterized 2Fe-2S/4Fe-4S cluster protein (DUF4445 family)